MATNILNMNPESRKRSEEHHYQEGVIYKIAQMLSGYDEATWNKLKRSRKLTYVRAASTLFFDFPKFKKYIESPD